MSAGVAQAPIRAATNTRRFPRFSLSVPADVTVLRSGIPYTIPGRSITIGERGLGVALAGEVRAGDPVGLEFRLPDSGGRLQLKAVVRYHALLQCGLEFLNLTSEQQTLIEHWTRKKSATTPQLSFLAAAAESSAIAAIDSMPASAVTAPPITDSPLATIAAVPVTIAESEHEQEQKRQSTIFRPALWAVLVTTLMIGGFGWWHWRQAWNELESQLPASTSRAQPAPIAVPAETMEKLIIHKIEPIYPEAARGAHIQGVVVLETLIGSDGSVVDVHASSGPDELISSAVDAVKWWRFQPYLINGQAVQVKTALAVEFRGD